MSGTQLKTIAVYEFLSGGGAGWPVPPALQAVLAQGREMLAALTTDLLTLPGLTVTVASRDYPAGLPATVRCFTPPAEATAESVVASLAASHDACWVIAPESDGILARLCALTRPSAWIGSDLAAIQLSASKRATLQVLSAAGIATPWVLTEGRSGTAATPPPAAHWVVKPDDGAGSENTRRFAAFDAALADYRARRSAGHSATLQVWIEGEPLSLSLLCEAGTVELLSINRQDITLAADGTVGYRGVATAVESLDGPRGALLAALAGRIAAAVPGLAGFVGVDLVWHPQRGPVVIEINPRVTCAYAGLTAGGGRLAGRVLALHQRLKQADQAQASTPPQEAVHGG